MPSKAATPPPASTADLIARRQLWPVSEAAYLLGFSTRTLYRKVESGELRLTRAGGRVYVSDAELKRFVANLEAAS